MEDQRDLISNHEQLPMLGQRAGAPERKCSQGALYTGFSVLVALLLAGQATTAYFLYQQQGRLDKLTDHVMHLLLKSDPLKVYPQLKGSFPENLKRLRNTMEGLDWKVFENWMRQWLLFEMSKNSLEEKPTQAPTKEPLDVEDLSSGLGVTKQDLN